MKARGLTLIEIVIGIALVAMLVVAFAVSLLAAVYAQRIKLRNMAAALADEELAAVRVSTTSGLTAQTSGPILGTLFAQGVFSVVSDNTAPSAGRALNAATSTMTSIMPLPKDAYDDFTLTAKLKVNPGSPSNWKAGLLFRARDLNNRYEASLTSTALTLKKNVGGVTTTLYSDVRSIAQGSWQTLSVTESASSITVAVNGTNAVTLNDASFMKGMAALAAWNGASVNFDDVSIAGNSWNFDATTVGDLHADWLRFGFGDLPSGTGTLTIATPYSDTTFKTYTANISWIDRSGSVRSLSESMQKAN